MTDNAAVVQLGSLPETCIEDRQRYWAAMCSHGPVLIAHADKVFGTHPPADTYYLTQHQDIVTALRSPDIYVREGHAMTPQLRAIVQPLLSPRALRELEPELRRRAAAMIGQRAPSDPELSWAEFTDLTDTFACEVFLTLAGMPMGSSPSGYDLTQAIAARSTGFAAGLCETLDATEAAQLVVRMIGVDARAIRTVSTAIRNAVVELDQDRRQPHTDSKKLIAFVDNLVRHWSPQPVIVRTNAEAITVTGVTIPAGSRIALPVEAVSVGHLAFGSGEYSCVAAHLAKTAVAAFISEWLTPKGRIQ